MNVRDLQKTIVITGAAQGIGYHLVHHFLAKGFRVAALDSHQAALKALESRMAPDDEHFLAVLTDVSNEQAVIRALDQIIKTFKTIDIVINNAAISRNTPIEEIELNEWKQVLDVNLTGPFLLAKHCAKYLRNSKGCIVNMASTRARMSEANTEAYSASKGGIEALTHALAISLGPDIRVNSVSPGWIDVSHLQHPIAEQPTAQEWPDYEHQQHPCGRIGKPEDIAAIIDYLIGDRAGFVTGQNFTIDGGMTKKMIYAE